MTFRYHHYDRSSWILRHHNPLHIRHRGTLQRTRRDHIPSTIPVTPEWGNTLVNLSLGPIKSPIQYAPVRWGPWTGRNFKVIYQWLRSTSPKWLENCSVSLRSEGIQSKMRSHRRRVCGSEGKSKLHELPLRKRMSCCIIKIKGDWSLHLRFCPPMRTRVCLNWVRGTEGVRFHACCVTIGQCILRQQTPCYDNSHYPTETLLNYRLDWQPVENRVHNPQGWSIFAVYRSTLWFSELRSNHDFNTRPLGLVLWTPNRIYHKYTLYSTLPLGVLWRTIQCRSYKVETISENCRI